MKSEAIDQVSVLQYPPHPGLKPLDLRYAFYLVDGKSIKLGIHLPKALKYGGTELLAVMDNIHDWRFLSPAFENGKMSLATDGENSKSREDDIDSVKFIYGHHAFDGDLPLDKLPVLVFDETSSRKFYSHVNSILEEMGESAIKTTTVTRDALGLDDDEDDLESDSEPKKEITKEEALSIYKEKVKSLVVQDEVVDEEAVAYRKVLRTIKLSGNVVNAMQDQLIYNKVNGMDSNTYNAIKFMSLLGTLEFHDYTQFLEPLNSSHSVYEHVKGRPTVHSINPMYYAVHDVEVAKSMFKVMHYMTDDEIRNSLFIPRYGRVLVDPSSNLWKDVILEFNVRFYNNQYRYRVYYPYVNMSNKNSPYFASYDSLKPLNTYSHNKFKYWYSDINTSSSIDQRWMGRVVVMEGEINSYLCSLLREEVLVISLGTSAIPDNMLNKIYNSISPTSVVEVFLDDRVKSANVCNRLRHGKYSYHAHVVTLPEEYEKLKYDYEDAVRSLFIDYPEVAYEYLAGKCNVDTLLEHMSHTYINSVGTCRKLDIDSNLLPNLPKVEQRSISELLVSSLIEDQYVDDIEDNRVRTLTNEIFDTSKSTLEDNEAARLEEIVANDESEMNFEFAESDSTAPTLIRYVRPSEKDNSLTLMNMYENDEPRFKSRIYGMEILGKENYKELKASEAEWYRLSQSQMDRLTKKVSSTLGYNPSQQLIQELGFDLDSGPTVINSKPRHVALALGASGGKSVGLRAAVCSYYSQILKTVVDLKLDRVKGYLKSIVQNHPAPVQEVLLPVFSRSSHEMDVSEIVRKFKSLYYELPDEVSNKINAYKDVIIKSIRQRTGNGCEEVLKIIRTIPDAGQLQEFLESLDTTYSKFKSVLSNMDPELAEHYIESYKLVYETCSCYPSDYIKLITPKEGQRNLERGIAPMDNLRSAVTILNKLSSKIDTKEFNDFKSEVFEFMDKVESLTMVIACPSQIEVDKYFSTLHTVCGIDSSFIKRFHSGCYHGETLAVDDTVMISTPLSLVTHQRIDRPSRVSKFMKHDGTIVPRKVIVIDESINTRSSIFVPEYVLSILNSKLNNKLCQWLATTEELEEVRKQAQYLITEWLNNTTQLDSDDRHLYRELSKVYFPTRKMPRSYHELDVRFTTMSDTERYGILDAVDCIVYGLSCVYKYYMTEAVDTESGELREAPVARVLNSLLEDDDETSESGEVSKVDDDTKLRLYKYLLKLCDYYDKPTDNPTSGCDSYDRSMTEAWWYYLALDVNSGSVLVLPNPLSRTFSDVSVVLLDATSYDTLTNVDAEGINQDLMSRILSISVDESLEVDSRNRMLIDLIHDGIANHLVTTQTATNLMDAIKVGKPIDQSLFISSAVRKDVDPWISSEKMSKFIYNSGHLGFRNSSSNMYDLNWTVLKIPGPPISLSSVRMLQLPIEKVSSSQMSRVDINGEYLYVPRRMLEFDELRTLNEALCGDYGYEFIRKVPTVTPQLRDTLYEVAVINRIHLANEEMIMDYGYDRILPSSISDYSSRHPEYKDSFGDYDVWVLSKYNLEGCDWTGIRTTPVFDEVENHLFSNGQSSEKGKRLLGVVLELRVGSYYERKEYWYSSFDVYTKRQVMYSRNHVDHVVKNWCTNHKKLIIITAMTALSLDTLTSVILEYLILPNIIEKDRNGDLSSVPRSLNVFTWRSINHVYTGLLGKHTYEYFPPIKKMIDTVRDSGRDVLEVLSSNGLEISPELIDLVNVRNQLRVNQLINEITEESDYNTIVRSEVKALPLLLFARVQRKVDEMYHKAIADNSENLDRLRDLSLKLQDYLMLTHHNSTECKATSDYQHATGTMIVGLHKLPYDTILEHRVDMGDNYHNDGQAVALMTQELYRCRLRKGTVHNPRNIDLITVNCDADIVNSRVLSSNRSRSIIDNTLHDTLRHYLNDIRSSIDRYAFYEDESSRKVTRDKIQVAMMMVLDSAILQHYHYKSNRHLPIDVSNDELLQNLIESTDEYRNSIGLRLLGVHHTSYVTICGHTSNDSIRYSTEILLSELSTPIRNYLSSGKVIQELIPNWSSLLIAIPQLSIIR